jgi:rhamnosyl/mannosyltransferase
MEVFLADLAEEQAAAGHAVRVVVHEGTPFRRGCVETRRGVRVRRVPILGQAAYTPIAPGFVWALHEELRRDPPDVIHLHMPNVSAFWTLLPLLSRRPAPTVVHWHADVLTENMPLVLKIFYRIYAPLERRLLARAKRVIVSSPPYLKSSKTLGPFHDKCIVVPLGMRPERLAPSDAPTKIGEGKIVLSVGRFTYYKGFEYLIRAAENIQDAVIIIAGGGPLLPAMQELTAELGLQDKVLLPGRVSDEELAELFRQCEVFCLPSIDRAEAFGVVLLEAMNAGKALLTAHVEGSGMSWVNQDGETGMLVPGRDPEALGSALGRLLADADLRKRMGSAGQRRFHMLFHIKVVETALARVYTDALGQTQGMVDAGGA